ncbi:WD40 repeat-like protein [Heliocybe sulcata]|uniref:Elongator complex protein 2 n=1 Tax=Heliocybe sulcata TaxID=5364 RepID=A0A5C3NQN3_9AGAM|nr:WD40 repeat-like protein [Heliocybe sulcata]
MVQVSTAYISASVNRYSQAGSSSASSLTAFGSSKYVALWNTADATGRGVYQTLPGHEGLVTCTYFARDDLLLSGDDRGFMRCWQLKDNEARLEHWKAAYSFRAHDKGLSCLHHHDRTLATGSSDGSVKIWTLVDSSTGEFKEAQTIDLRGKYPLSVRLTTLLNSQAAVLAIGGTDKNVQVWTRSDDSFVRSAILSGHEDWVRGLDFHSYESEGQSLILASGSQDSTIRLWKFEMYSRNTSRATDSADASLSDDLLDAFESSLGTLGDAEEGGRQISMKRHILTVKSSEGSTQQFSITFDALLVGHEAGITSLAWRPTINSNSNEDNLTLLSTSTDSSLILWSPSTIISTAQGDSTAIWINRQRFGDVGGQRLGGFVGGLWSRGGAEALAWGWSGGWRRWRCAAESSNDEEVWAEVGAVTGHNGPVRGIAWSPSGEYLISTSLDQTTRIHGPVPLEDGDTTPVWHELARPQVHGYDLIDVVPLDPFRFVSIADEKVVRVFEAPQTFVDALVGLKVANLPSEDETERPAAASVPPLGLSNKAVKDASIVSTAYDWNAVHRRPFEAELSSMTLWPEIEKVFGHGYESISLAASTNKKLIATACKSTTAEHAVVRVFDTQQWQPVGQPLGGHSLTVTRIAFSPDDRYILTVSRDRSWRLFEAQPDSGFAPVAADKSHGRIIWDCAWAHEGDVFATASRDKTVRIWHPEDEGRKWSSVATLKTKEAATAVAFTLEENRKRRLAVGTETGEITIYKNATTSVSDWQLECTIDRRLTHIDHIYRLAWRPVMEGMQSQLACCSEDGTLKILVVR